MSPVDTVVLAQRLEELIREHRVLSDRVREIQEEAKTIFGQMNDEFSPLPPRNRAPLRPRPLDDKISISVGRTIAFSQRHGWDRDRTTAMAVAKATEIARRHGLAELSPEILNRIDRKVSRRLQTAA